MLHSFVGLTHSHTLGRTHIFMVRDSLVFPVWALLEFAHRNKFCFTGGMIEASVQLPGANNIVGMWPAIWTMGNLGRAGYGASLEGMVCHPRRPHSPQPPN